MEHKVHLAGALKQHNKPFKSGRHASKGSLRRQTRGKVSRQSIKGTSVAGNASRKRAASVIAAKKKQEVLFSKRLGSSAGPPKIIGIVSLGAAANLSQVVSMLVGDQSMVKPGPMTLVFSEVKQRFTLFAVPRDLDSVLDVAKVADIILFVVPVDGGVDHLGESFISLIKAQGLPSVLTVIQGLAQANEKAKKEIKKQMKAFLEFQFPDNSRLLPLDEAKHVAQVLRFLSTIRIKQLSWRERRPYLLVDSLSFTPSGGDVGTLCASGYLRGGPLSANDLVYIPDFGDFRLSKIEGPPEPTPFSNRENTANRRKGMDTDQVVSGEISTLSLPDEKQESLASEITPDVMGNEQNWGDEDDADLMMAEQERKRKKKVPAGTSDYQAAWIFESDEEDDSDLDGDEDLGDVDDMRMTSSHEPSEEENEDRSEPGHDHDEELPDNEEEDEGEVEGLETAHDIDMELAQRERERLKTQNEEDLEFPDERDTPEHTKAKVRFQKYRGLKSFRHSPWDPKENLPVDYARIFQFQNFKRTSKRVLENRDGIIEGTYITLHIVQVPASIQSHVSVQRPFVVSGLFAHEHKISVLNFVLNRHQAFSGPVKSKETLIFQCGFRRYLVNPVFSQNTTGSDRHKTERFLQPGRNTVATIYAPVTLPPCPLMVFKRADTMTTEEGPLPAGGQTVGGHWLAFVASGYLLSVDPDRILLSRIILTGYPFKVHKSGAVIKHMFHNPEDVRWFKPVEVWTKHGRKGHIKEPLGTHGLMKCIFDGHLLNHDTVCMSLYKRSFPRWGKITTIHGAPLTSQPVRPGLSRGSNSEFPALTAEALARLNEHWAAETDTKRN